MGSEPDVPEELYRRIRDRCLALPETTVRSDAWAHAFEIRRKAFAWLVAATDDSGRTIASLVVDADPDERAALLAGGHPYFSAASNARRLGMVLDDDTDWDEVTELITESYRLLAPKKLSKLLDEPAS